MNTEKEAKSFIETYGRNSSIVMINEIIDRHKQTLKMLEFLILGDNCGEDDDQKITELKHCITNYSKVLNYIKDYQE